MTEYFNELDYKTDKFEIPGLEVYVFPGLSNQWIEFKIEDLESETQLLANLSVADARKLRAWLDRAIPSDSGKSPEGPK